MVRESLVLAFAITLVALLTLLGVVTAPLFSTPPNWGVTLSRFYVAFLPIIFLVIGIVFIIMNVRKLDKGKEQTQINTLKEAVKEALKEDRDRSLITKRVSNKLLR
ncbi:hypothetical protein ACFLVS_04100, partial [Chloroflexota bacterium]